MKKNILVLGSGLVAGPLVKYLLEQTSFKVIVSDIIKEKAQELVEAHPRGIAKVIDSKDDRQLQSEIKDSDVVISLLPFDHHPRIAEFCIRFKKDMVTASYVSPEIKAMDERAKSAGVTILNEIGLDPGIDHMEAMRIIHELKNKNAEITSFKSYCGGLPAPEACDNPWGYKFSWSPTGVLHASKSPAKFLEDGRIISIASQALFDEFRIIPIQDLGEFEGYPNRNSIPYIKLYGIESVRTMLRGTLRFPGWCQSMKSLIRLNLLAEEEIEWKGTTLKEIMHELLEVPEDKDIKESICDYLNLSPNSEIIKRFEWLGLWSETKIPLKSGTALDILSEIMYEKMRFKPGERDMIVLQHEFNFNVGGGKNEKIISSLIDFGIPFGSSSMARTVGLPAAIGTKMLLEGKITNKGVLIPILPEIYNPILEELKEMGISFKTRRLTV